MRILHTADWHLGVSSGPVSRAPDHSRFLEWLEGFLVEQQVDALVVAGDIFDSHQPSAAALGQYYDFLARCGRHTGLQVVVVGGNHDAPSRLQAPARVLRALNIHVCGGLTQESIERGDHIVPLRAKDGSVAAIVLAVPYVHEFRLGIRTTDADRSEIRRRFTESFRDLYRELVDRAEEEYPGLPILATGHLTVGDSATRQDYPHEIHQVGTIEALAPSIFDPRIRYVALGHIHRSYPVDAERRAWYSGTPVATSLAEGKTPRRVLLVDVDPESGACSVESHEVPAIRILLEVRGTLDEVKSEIRDLRCESELPALLFVRIVQEEVPTGIHNALQEALDTHPDASRPVLVERRTERASAPPEARVGPSRPLDELEMRDVFEALIKARGETADDALMAAFDEVQSMSAEDVEDRVQALTGASK